MYTTLNKIRQCGPCATGWEKLLKNLGKVKADDEELPLLTVLDSNGIDDAIWCFRAIDGNDTDMRRYAICCIRQVLHQITDPRSIAAIEIAERHLDGQATDEELRESRMSAYIAYTESKSMPDYIAYTAASVPITRYVATTIEYVISAASTLMDERTVQETELRRMLSLGKSSS
jgi:hypothetical protein